MRRCNGAVLSLVCVLVTAGLYAPRDGRLEVEELIVKAPDGTERARLGLSGESVALVLRDADGEVAAGFGLSTGKEDPTVPEGRPLLHMGAPGVPLVSLGIAGMNDGEVLPSLTLSPPDLEEGVQVRLQAGSDKAVLGFMSFGPGGVWGVVPRVVLLASREGLSGIHLRDSDGELLFEAPSPHETSQVVQWEITGTDDVRRHVEETPAGSNAWVHADCRSTGVTDETLAALARVELRMQRNPDLVDAWLDRLCALDGLEVLDLNGCPGLSSAAVERLRACLPDTEVLFGP